MSDKDKKSEQDQLSEKDNVSEMQEDASQSDAADASKDTSSSDAAETVDAEIVSEETSSHSGDHDADEPLKAEPMDGTSEAETANNTVDAAVSEADANDQSAEAETLEPANDAVGDETKSNAGPFAIILGGVVVVGALVFLLSRGGGGDTTAANAPEVVDAEELEIAQPLERDPLGRTLPDEADTSVVEAETPIAATEEEPVSDADTVPVEAVAEVAMTATIGTVAAEEGASEEGASEEGASEEGAATEEETASDDAVVAEAETSLVEGEEDTTDRPRSALLERAMAAQAAATGTSALDEEGAETVIDPIAEGAEETITMAVTDAIDDMPLTDEEELLPDTVLDAISVLPARGEDALAALADASNDAVELMPLGDPIPRTLNTAEEAADAMADDTVQEVLPEALSAHSAPVSEQIVDPNTMPVGDMMVADVTEGTVTENVPAPMTSPQAPTVVDVTEEIAPLLDDFRTDVRDEVLAEMAETEVAINRALEETEREVAELRSELNEQTELQRETNERLASVSSKLESIESAELSDARNSTVLLALNDLSAGVESGAPFVDELEVVERVIPNARDLSTLRPYAGDGIATTVELERRYKEVARLALSGERRDEADGAMDRFFANVAGLFTVRPLGDVDGDSASAIIARAENRLFRDDLPGSLEELRALDGAAREAFAEWIADAEAKVEARESIDRLRRSLTSQAG